MPTAEPPTQGPTMWQRIRRSLAQWGGNTKVSVAVVGPRVNFTASKEPGSPWHFGKDEKGPDTNVPGEP